MKALAVVALCALVLPGQALAKEIVSVTVCGASGCRTIKHPPQDIASGGDAIPDPAPALAPYYTVTFAAGEQGAERWRIFYVPQPPSLGVPRVDRRLIFDRLDGVALARFRNATRGLDPYPAPAITRATVGGKDVTDPSSYARLFTVQGEDASLSSAADFVPVVLHSARPTPWTGRRYLMFNPSTGALERGTRLIALPDGLAAAMASGASLDAVDETGGRSALDGRVVVAALLGAAAFVCFATWAARRRGRSVRALPD